MNKENEIFRRAREQVSDEGVFSQDQILLLQRMIYNIEDAVKSLIIQERG